MMLIVYGFVTFLISAVLVPLTAYITKREGITARSDHRTVHKGIISRGGGYAIYIAFLISAMIFLKTDTQINAILLGGFVVFLTGFLDDIYDLPPKLKLLGQVIGALIVIFYGNIVLRGLGTSFLPSSIARIVAIIVTIGWIIGITNAINLIDGLDGLCAGISIIVFFTITLSSLHFGRTDIASLSSVMIGAIGGFLLYNFHPAKVFMGDGGALFIGFMLAAISLLGYGFKSTTFFTMGAPIVFLIVPIMDTLIAIVRRKVAGQRFDEADKKHLHHQLMFTLNLGHVKSVLILYAATFLFSVASYLYMYNKWVAVILFLILILIFELFVEMTDMISRDYKPILAFANIFLKRPDLPVIKTPAVYKKIIRNVVTDIIVLAVAIAGIITVSTVLSRRGDDRRKIASLYQSNENSTALMTTIYNRLTSQRTLTSKRVGRYAAAYFAVDYYTLSNKVKDEIGGLSYFYKDRRNAFQSYAKQDYYRTVNSLIEEQKADEEVISYNVDYSHDSNVTISGLEDYDYYTVGLTLTFNQENQILKYTTIHVEVTQILKNNKYSVVSLDLISGE